MTASSCHCCRALVKLEVATEQGSLCYDVVQLASVFVLHCLSSSSCQGLANLLWAFSKMAEPQLAVMMKIVAEMTVRLMTAAYNGAFDAQVRPRCGMNVCLCGLLTWLLAPPWPPLPPI
jgi:hypothetical protein